MRFFRDLAGALLVVAACAGAPAYAAQGGEGNNTGCNGQGNPNSPCEGGTVNNGGAGGSATATATAAAAASASSVSIQGQKQGQGQGQEQGQSQSYQGEQNVKVETRTDFTRYAPPVSAPALTSAGTGVCLGSVSIGLSGPMAGASFGITKVDKGCERRSASALLFQYGYKDAALRLLMKDDEVREAVGGDAPAAVKKAAAVDVPDLKLTTVLGSEATYNAPLTAKEAGTRQSIAEAMATTQAARATAFQGQ